MTDQTIIQAVPRITTFNRALVSVALFSAIGLIAMLNAMLLFPGIGMLIAQYDQF